MQGAVAVAVTGGPAIPVDIGRLDATEADGNVSDLLPSDQANTKELAALFGPCADPCAWLSVSVRPSACLPDGSFVCLSKCLCVLRSARVVLRRGGGRSGLQRARASTCGRWLRCRAATRSACRGSTRPGAP
jgi:Peroxidase